MREAVVRAAEEKREADKGLAAAAGGGVLNAGAGEIARGGEGRGALSRRVAGREVYNYVIALSCCFGFDKKIKRAVTH